MPLFFVELYRFHCKSLNWNLVHKFSTELSGDSLILLELFAKKKYIYIYITHGETSDKWKSPNENTKLL